MMQRPTILLLVASFLATATAFTNPYPYTHTNCGIEQTITDTPQKVITMNQGATEFMPAMGLQNNIAGTRAVSDVDPIWPRYKEAYESIPKIPELPPDSTGSYPTDEQMVNQYKADFIFASWRSAFREYEPPRQNAEETDKSKGGNPVHDPTGGKGGGKSDKSKTKTKAKGKGTDDTQYVDPGLAPVGGVPADRRAALAGFPHKREDLMTQEEIRQIQADAPKDKEDRPLCFGHLSHKGCTLAKCKSPTKSRAV